MLNLVKIKLSNLYKPSSSISLSIKVSNTEKNFDCFQNSENRLIFEKWVWKYPISQTENSVKPIIFLVLEKNHWTGFYFADSTMVLTRFLLISPLITLIVLMSKNHIFNRIGCNLRFFKNFNISPHFGSFGNSKLILVGQLTLLEWPLWSAHHGILTAAATATDTNAVNYHYYNHVELYF